MQYYSVRHVSYNDAESERISFYDFLVMLLKDEQFLFMTLQPTNSTRKLCWN